MTTITKQQLNRDFGQQSLTLRNATQHANLVNYQGLVEHGGRIYRISILTPPQHSEQRQLTISELIAIPGAHVQIEVYAMFAVARFNTAAYAELH